MITEEEYKKAIVIIERYHRQRKISIDEFLKTMYWDMSGRLKNILLRMKNDPDKNVCIHRINREMLLKEKHCGTKTCEEFFELRSYIDIKEADQ